MKIAFLTPEYPHLRTGSSGGIGTSIKNLAFGLQQHGCSIRILIYGQNEDAVFDDNGICIQQIKNVKFKGLSWLLTRKKLERIVNELYTNKKIDLIEAPDWTGITAFMKLKVPLIIRFHGSDTYFCHLEKRKQKKKNFWLEKIAVNNAQAFIAPTTYAGDRTKELFNIKNKVIKTIHYGLELDKFQNAKSESFERGLILYIGTLIRKKGVFELPEIFSSVRNKIPETRFVLIGNDASDIQTGSLSTWELLKNKFKVKNLQNVTYLGKIPYDEVQEWIVNANVCVFPSFAETFGMVTIEAMALKKAVVTSNFGWTTEIIDDTKNGFLVSPKNHQEFATKIVTLLSDDELTNEFATSARRKVEQNFDIKKVAKQNMAFYKNTIQLYEKSN